LEKLFWYSHLRSIFT